MAKRKSVNKTLVVTRPSSDDIMLVVGLVLQHDDLDIERLLSGLVPEMARGGVRGGLLVVGDSTLILRLQGQEVTVDEVDTGRLLALADIEEPYRSDNAVDLLQRWIVTLREGWRDRLVGDLRQLLVPHVVAALAGDIEVADGIWGDDAKRIATRTD